MADDETKQRRASLGGKARAATMTSEERTRVASLAASERWAKAKGLPQETLDGVIQIGPISIPCAILESPGGKIERAIPRAGLRSAFGVKSRSSSAGSSDDPNLPAFLAGPTVSPYVTAELREMFSRSIAYRPKAGTGGAVGYAYPADILALMCEAISDANTAGKLQQSQRKMAEAATILHRALARVGITALVDEATGYQYERAHDELQRLLEKYVVEEMRPYVPLFPNDFFRLVYNLHGWRYEPGVTQGPRYVGKLINKYVYDQLPPGVHEELRKKNPVRSNGRRQFRHHQFLTLDVGEPHLDKQIVAVMTLMRAAPDKETFEAMFKRAFPKSGDQMSLRLSPPAGQAEDEQE